MRKLSKIISCVLAIIFIFSAFSGLSVNASAVQQTLPYINNFDNLDFVPSNTNGVYFPTSYTCTKTSHGHTDSSGNTLTTGSAGSMYVADGRFTLKDSVWSGQSCGGIHGVEFNFEPQNSGVLVAEFDYYVTDSTKLYATDGLVIVENSAGEKVAGWNAKGRGTIYGVENGAFGTTSVRNGSWTVNSYQVKIEIDFGQKTWSAAGTRLNVEGLPCNNANDVSKLKIVLPSNGDSIDNVKIYKKVSAVQTASDYDLMVGDTQILDINYTDGAATDITFTSSDESVAKVSKDGVVTAVNGGYAEVSAVNELCGISLSFGISVKASATKLTIDQKDRIIYKGETFRLTYSTPKYTKSGNVVWSSSNRNIASVTNNGVVTGVAEGVAVITATSEYGHSASFVIEVADIDKGTSVVSINNAGFETNISAYTNWNPNGTVTRATGGASGNYCLKLTADSYVQQAFADSLEAGELYTVSFMLKINSLGEGSYAFFEVESTGYDQVAAATYFTVTDGWEKVYVDFVVPKGCIRPKIFLRMFGNGEVYFDDVVITKQKDMTEVTLFSDGLALNSIVSGAPLTTANIRYVPKTSGASELIAAVYEGEYLSDIKHKTVSGSSNLTDLIDLTKLNENSTIGILNWNTLTGMKPIDTKKTFLDKTQRSEVYNFFEINRMRGVYGGIDDIYDENIKNLITDNGINTLILNIIGTFYGGNIRMDMTALNKVLDDAEKLAEETGVKIIPKISYGDNATVGNTAYGAFHLGAAMLDSGGTEVETSNAPCPRAREYWKAQVTDILSEVAKHKKLIGGVIDFEMYGAYRSSYPGSCMCNTCAADFDSVYGTSVSVQDITARRQYVIANKLYAAYNEWHKAEITAIASEVREAVHKINADFIFGYMARIEYIAGVSEGLGTQQMPVVIFNEQEYTGNLSHMYVNQANIKLKDWPVVYATGLSAEPNKIQPEALAEIAVEAAKNSMGYWIYSSNYLVGTGNTDDVKSEYIAGIKAANDAIDARYGL